MTRDWAQAGNRASYLGRSLQRLDRLPECLHSSSGMSKLHDCIFAKKCSTATNTIPTHFTDTLTLHQINAIICPSETPCQRKGSCISRTSYKWNIRCRDKNTRCCDPARDRAWNFWFFQGFGQDARTVKYQRLIHWATGSAECHIDPARNRTWNFWFVNSDFAWPQGPSKMC